MDIVSLIGPITYEDLETVQIDKSRYVCYPKEMQYIVNKLGYNINLDFKGNNYILTFNVVLTSNPMD